MGLLEQLGITKAEMLERITDRALGIAADHRQTGEESWEDIPFSSVVDRNIKAAIERLVASMESKISERIDSLLNEKMIEVFERAYQPVDRWGNPVGPMTTVRDRIMDMAESYWMEPVDSGGKRDYSGYLDRKKRFEWAVERCIADVMNNEIRQAATTLAADLKAKIPQAIGKEISDTVVKYLK